MKKLFFGVFALFAVLAACEKEEVAVTEDLDVPFTSQAPEGNWSEPWQNACEETSILMVDSFYEGEELNREEEKQRILEILQTKREEIKVSQDESLATISELINSLDLNWTTTIKRNPTVGELIEELANNRPVILPVLATKLPNPFYEGVDYHVIVLVGYDQETGTFKVNDPGTQFGEDLSYDYDTLMNAIHDLNTEDYEEGEKRVLFTQPKGPLTL